jgi:hypothetical protein
MGRAYPVFLFLLSAPSELPLLFVMQIDPASITGPEVWYLESDGHELGCISVQRASRSETAVFLIALLHAQQFLPPSSSLTRYTDMSFAKTGVNGL